MIFRRHLTFDGFAIYNNSVKLYVWVNEVGWTFKQK